MTESNESIVVYGVPHTCTMRQFRQALLELGLLETVTQAIAEIGGSAAIDWEFATEVQMEWPLVSQLAALLGYNQQQIDELFILASNQ